MSQRYALSLVWVIAAIASIGVVAVLPVLPVFATKHGADPRFIGWMIASYSAANLVSLPVGGWISDRFGRKPVMAMGLLAYALASLGFLVTDHLAVFLALRAIEGLAAACVVPAAMAYAADHAPADGQGAVMARMTAADTLGVLVGPLIGGVLADTLGIGSPFWALAVLCGLCLLLLTRLQERPKSPPVRQEDGQRPLEPWWQQLRPALAVGLMGRNLASGLITGFYEVIWPLFMLSLGSTLWQISLSWTLFAVPSVLLSRPVGRWIDRIGGARLAVWGAAVSAVLPLFYAAAGGPWTMLALSAVEGIGFAVAYPASAALLVQVGPETVRGRAIGWISTVRTIGIMAASLVVPDIYARNVAHCFGVIAAVMIVGVLWLAVGLIVDGRRRGRPAPLPAAQPLAGSLKAP